MAGTMKTNHVAKNRILIYRAYNVYHIDKSDEYELVLRSKNIGSSSSNQYNTVYPFSNASIGICPAFNHYYHHRRS